MTERNESGARPRVRHDIQVMTLGVCLMALALVGALFYFLDAILKPFFVAIFIFFLIKPGADWLQGKGSPRWLAYCLVLAFLSVVVFVVGFNIYTNVLSLEENLPRYQARIGGWIDQASQRIGWADDEGHIDWRRHAPRERLQSLGARALGWTFGTLIDYLGMGLAVLIYLIFIIIEAGHLPNRIRKAFNARISEQVVEMGRNIDLGIRKYLWVKTGVSLATGSITGLILFLFGVDYWFLWAVLTFLFNYVPYIGSLFASIFPVALAFIQFDSPWNGAALAVILFANQFFWGNYMEPRWAGRELDISPLTLLLIVAFWGWVWGITGMVLSVPAAVVIKIALANFERTRPLAILMSEEG